MASVDSLLVESHLLREDVKDRVKAQVIRAAAERGILLVKTTDLPSEGLLSDRQQQWVNSAPYDAHTQNPVLYRHEVDQARPPKGKTEREEARQEVQSLPDVITRPSDVEGGVEARLREGRKERHEAALQDMKDELALISSEFEMKIQSAIDLLKVKLAENKQVVAGLFGRVSMQEDLVMKTLVELEELWEQLSCQTTIRQDSIQALDTRLSDLETERAGNVTEVLHDYAHQISRIAYLLPNDVERLFEEEAHLINTAVLENRKVYSQLCMHLHTAELCAEREHRDRWESILADWKELMCQSTLAQFQAFLSSEPLTDPPKLQRVREQLAAEQRGIQRRREELLSQFSNLSPPKATKASVHELKSSANKLHQQLESVHTKFLLGYQRVLESLSGECEDEMDRCKDHLISSGAVDSSSIHKVLNNLFVPQLEKVASKLREGLHGIERSLDATLTSQRAQFEDLFGYCLGAALLWDQHSDSLAASQRAFQERLDNYRSNHDRENQNLEANLDLLLDRLRQGPTQEALKEYLQEALRMLDTIKQGYEGFHLTVLGEITGYPELVRKELDWYDSALCQYLGVSRTPIKKSKSRINVTRAPSEMQIPSPRPEPRLSRMDSRGSRQENRTKSRKSKPQRSKTTASGMGLPKPPLTTINSASSLVEVITTSGGVQFYLQSTDKSSKKGDGTFLTQDEESEGSAVSFASESIALTQEVFTKTRERMVLGFLEQLEQWRTSSTDKAQTTVAGKEEECHTELDLRLHLHEPRPSRVEQDIHNVRLAELVAHRDRVTRHSTGLTTTLTLQRGAGERLRDLLAECGERFAEQVEGLVAELDTCSKTTDLLKVQSTARESLEQHVEQLTRLSSEQTDLSGSVLDQLSESNTAYINSIKLFSEGGNYCPEEVDLFVKKLDKLSGKITSTQAHISSEMGSVTEEQVAASRDHLAQFDNVFKFHLDDLSFLETISQTSTSAQVKIKSEVMSSNSQCASISDCISEVRRLVEAESTPSSKILSRLPSLFDLLTGRVDYLYCRAAQYQGSRVGDHHGITVSGSGVKPIGSMNVTKSIMEHVSKHSASDRKLSVTPASSGAKIPKSEQRLSVPTQAVEYKKSGKQSRRKTAAVLERKNINFGIGGGNEDLKSFLPRIRTILRDMHSDLYQLTEAYYKSKGSRQSTRPSEIHESFEGHMDSLIAKSQSYRSQAEEYRNNCIQEFRDQLSCLMVLLESVPRLVFADLLQEWKESGKKIRETARRELTLFKEANTQERMSHQRSLRPNLGHPSQSDALDTLCLKEAIRHRQLVMRVEEHAEQMRTGEWVQGMQFVAGLSEATKSLLMLFDKATNDSEVIPGDNKVKEKYTMEELLRKHVQGTLTPDPSSATLPPHLPGPSSGKVVWPPLPQSEEKFVSKKCTTAHETIIKERDAVFEEYCRHRDTVLEEIKLSKQEEKSLEEKWFENWTQSVHKVRQIYSS